MSKIVEWFLLPLFFIMSIVYAFNSFGNTVELKKIFHHITNDDSYLECANVSLYFSHEPCIKKIDADASNVNNIQKQSFFFPCVINSNECEAMIQRINNYNDSYTIAIEKKHASESGIVLTFGCDPKKITLSYELFDSIGMQKGIVFR